MPHQDGSVLTRKSFLKGVGGFAAAGVGANLLAACGSSSNASGSTATKVKAAGLYRDLNEENFFKINDGVQYGAKLYGHTTAQPLIYHNDSQTEETVIQGALTALAPGELLALNAWDNTEESALTIAHLMKGKGYFVTQWNKPSGVFPWQIGPQWVSHIQFDSYQAEIELIGQVAKALGGTGGICYVQGLMTTTNAQDHWRGVQAALKQHPGLDLLSVEPGNWDRPTAFNLAQTWLSRFGKRVNAISCANDDMALGVLQAVKAVGRAGEVKITGGDGVHEAVQAVDNGTFVATAQFDSYWQGVVGTGMVLQAATGKIDPNKLTHEQRAFNGPFYLITKANAAKYLAAPKPSDYNFNNLWAYAQSPVTE
ncbi:MAG TPA: sugar ABC transporter substrate-binding protein [Solirubrobacteraceae bacterium]